MRKMAKKFKKRDPAKADRYAGNMQIVTSDTCAVCPTPCLRGLRYLARMSRPGAIGFGVPCILTKEMPKPKRK